MTYRIKDWRIWATTLGVVLITVLVLWLTVFAGTNDTSFTATGYSDVIRFQADGVATLQVRIFDLSGKEVWDSGVVSGDTIDWDRRNDTGERLAYGAYIYSAQGWNASGDLIFQKNGKLALMPGDQVQLQEAPAVSLPQSDDVLTPFRDEPFTFQPMAVNVDHSTESWAFGQVGIGTTNPLVVLDVLGAHVSGTGLARFKGSEQYGFMTLDTTTAGGEAGFLVNLTGILVGQFGARASDNAVYIKNRAYGTADVVTIASSGEVGIHASSPAVTLDVVGAHVSGTGLARFKGSEQYGFMTLDTTTAGGEAGFLVNLTGILVGQFGARASDNAVYIKNRAYGIADVVTITSTGNVGIGTTSPGAKLEIEASTGDLIAAYNNSNRVFVVKRTGEVRADGAYYSGMGDFHTGNADVAERINTSEWVDAGYVVEIDPEHPGFFRKSSYPYSTKVAGIISTSPGVILGNSFDEATDDWEDNRPVLAITGRVPCKATAENGAIEIGDLLVASSTPGIAMKSDPGKAIGAVIGKAMEPLKEGEGTIVVQVMLR